MSLVKVFCWPLDFDFVISGSLSNDDEEATKTAKKVIDLD